MRYIWQALLATLLLSAGVSTASAQAIVISSCGSVTLDAGNTQRPTYQDINGNQCVSNGTGGGTTTVKGAGTAGTPDTGVVTVQGISGGTAQNVNPDSVVDGVTRTATASSAAVGDSFPTTGYACLEFEQTANASGNTVTFQGSNDNVNFVSIPTRNVSQTGASGLQGAANNAATGVSSWVPSYVMPFMRWNVTTYVGGTTTYVVAMKRTCAPNISEVFVGNSQLSVTSLPGTSGAQAVTLAQAAAATTLSAKGVAGNAYTLNCVNSTTAGFIIVYNSATAVTGGAALTTGNILYIIPIGASAGFSDHFDVPIPASAGIQVLASTSTTTYTAMGTPPLYLAIGYK